MKSAPLWAWVVSGLSAPLAQTAARSSWPGVIALGVIGCAASCLVLHMAEKGIYTGRWYCLLQCVWLAAISGEIAQWSEDCWPTGTDFPVVPLTLLVLAVFAAWDGAERASRIGGVLFWFLALLYAIILGAGTENLKLKYMQPVWEMPEANLVVLFLLPVTAGLLPSEKRGGSIALAGLITFAVVVSLWTAGTLSYPVAQNLSQPFYEYSKSMSLLGVAERFESFASVALTMGYFTLLSLLLSAAGHLTEKAFPGKGRVGIVSATITAGAIMAFAPKIPQIYLAVCAILAWVILPLITGRMIAIKKSKKNEKSA